MKCKWGWLTVLMAVMSVSVQAEELAKRSVTVETFDVSPLTVYSGGEVHIRCTVRNTGDQPVNLRPQVRFTRPGMSTEIWADQKSQRLEPGQTFDYTAKKTFPFQHDYGPSPFGAYEIDVLVYDTDANVSIGGKFHESKLHFAKKQAQAEDRIRPKAVPAIVAYPDRPLHFVGEEVKVRGTCPEGKEIVVTGAVCAKSDVLPDGTFTVRFTARQPGTQQLVLRAGDSLEKKVDVYVTPAVIEFPRLFDTDQSYEVGIFTGAPRESMPKFPYWVRQLGIRFVAWTPYNGLQYEPIIDEALDNADMLGVTVALFGEDDCVGMPGVPITITSKGEQDSRMTNLLSDKYQKVFLERVSSFVSSLRHHKSFRYLLLMPEWLNVRANQGYDEENLSGFAAVLSKDRPDLTLPPTNQPVAWYKMLWGDEDLWERWLTWREERWTRYMIRMRDTLKAIKPDLELGTLESNFMHRGIWNMKMLVENGINVHAPHTNFPHGDPYWTTFIARDWYRLQYGFSPLFLSLGIWEDRNNDPEMILNGLFGIVKAGGTRIPTWCDTGLRVDWKYLNPEFGGKTRKLSDCVEATISDGALESVITDMIVGVDNHRKSKALTDAVYQIGQLPYKDRFDVYERQNGTLPIDFAVEWNKEGQAIRAESKNGQSAGDPHDSVYAVVQDWHPNGYVEMFVFNDGEEDYRTKRIKTVFGDTDTFSLVPNSLSERKLTVSVKTNENTVAFVDGQPWLHCQREGDRLTIKSIPFKPQQVRLLQLAPCGRNLPSVTMSQVDVLGTQLDLEQKLLWVKLSPSAEGNVTVQCADWGTPRHVEGGRILDAGEGSTTATVATSPNANCLVIRW